MVVFSATVSATIFSVVLLVACGSDDSSGSTTTTAASATTNPLDGAPTADEMRDALLTSDDLGPGWVTVQTEVFTSREDIPTLDPGIWCSAATEMADRFGALAGSPGAITGLRASGLSQGSSHQVTEQIFTGSAAEAFVDLVTSAIRVCDGVPWTTTDGGEVQIDVRDVAATGDASITAVSAIATAADGDRYVYRTRMLAARVGTQVMILQEADVQILGSTPLLTDDEWDDVVAAAVAKLAQL